MAKKIMKVILTENIKGIGKIDEIVSVSQAQAINVLIPNGKAVKADAKGLANLNKRIKDAEKKASEEAKKIAEIKEKIDNAELEILVKSEKGKMFGAVKSKDISKMISEKFGLDINHKNIKADFRALGKHTAIINLGKNVEAKVIINVK